MLKEDSFNSCDLEFNFLEYRQKKTKSIKKIVESALEKADKIDAVVIAYVTTLDANSQEITSDWEGPHLECLGLIQELKDEYSAIKRGD